jgi:hypothetical protein
MGMTASVTITPSSKDTLINEVLGQRNTNYGSNNIFEARALTEGQAVRGPVQFSVTWGTDVPPGAVISLAKLRLYYCSYPVDDPVGRSIYALRLLRRDWVELEATWNIYKTGSSWTTAGAGSDGNDYTSVDAATAVVPASFGWMEWDVTEQVKTAQTGSFDPAFIMRMVQEIVGVGESYSAYWYSRDEVTELDLRPQLFIYFPPVIPTVTTQDATDVTDATATGHGNITALGGENSDQRGFDWGVESGLYTHEVVEAGDFGTGAFTGSLTGLPYATTIYYRAKSHNSAGWGYGSEKSFVTEPILPTVTTQAATDVDTSTATGNGNITDTGGENNDQRGFDWGTSPGVYPYEVVEAGSFSTGAYTGSLTGLPNATAIYYRAKAHNGAGWAYGSEQSFDTLGIRVSTQLESDVTPFSATLNGTIDSKSVDEVTIRGFDWGTETEVYDHEVIDCGSFDVGDFYAPIAGLIPGTVYYFRAKAYDSTGWYYGLEFSFAVAAAELTVYTLNSSDVHPTYATLNGTIVWLGGENADKRGFDYGTSPGVYDHEVIEEGSFGVGDYSLPITGLTPGAMYYFRAKAHDSMGWHYGGEVALGIETLDATRITSKTAVLNGNIVSVGTTPITMRGFDLGTAPGVYTTSFWQPGIFGAGNYSRYTDALVTVSYFLLANTTYYFRAKARDSLGLHYGAELSFTTDPPVMEVTTWSATEYAATSAKLWGRITWLGLTNADQRGFDYGTTEGSLDQEVKESGSFGIGQFYLPITGLTPDEVYFFRAKAHDAVGWHYGRTVCLKISTLDATIISSTTAVIGLSINETGDEGGVPDEIAVDWGTESEPDEYPYSYAEEGNYPENIYNRGIGWPPRDAPLMPDTVYYYRTRFHDLTGWHYGAEFYFTTAPYTGTKGGNLADQMAKNNFI